MGKRLAQINHYPTLYPSSLGPLVFSPGPFGSLPFHSRTELRRTRVTKGIIYLYSKDYTVNYILTFDRTVNLLYYIRYLCTNYMYIRVVLI